MAERNFESLRIWQEARVFVNDVYAMMKNCKDYGFCTAEKHQELHDKAQSIASGLRNLINYIENNKK